MADEIILNNLSDDSKMKEYIRNELMPRVFHDVPVNVLNTGMFSLINEYLSQTLEQQSFTNTFFLNESFITKAVLPDSIYAQAAIFNIGYDFATPSSSYFLLELKIEDLFRNSFKDADTGLYQFTLDKDTKFNLANGNVYSLDYDIRIRYKDKESAVATAINPGWSVEYTNVEENYVSINKKQPYILYRVTDQWLCLFVHCSEYVRETHTVVATSTSNVPIDDAVITCNNHIAGFDVKYIKGDGSYQYIARDHILPMHDSVKDKEPYIHYIMDNPQTIRFMFQLNGARYFMPEINSRYEITIYTCHGKSANFTAYDNEQEQPNVITTTNNYSNNANVMKAAFVIGGSLGGTDIGNAETVRRMTIEAYNTANVISSDHDIDEWFETFYFKNVLYPYFFKRRDDPWGRIWSGFVALKDSDDYIFRTNTCHAFIPYSLLYANNDNTVTDDEVIIPAGWVWTYYGDNRYTVTPYTSEGSKIESAKTMASIGSEFVFANPFGIRIQKNPFAIGYFNPWINENTTCTQINKKKYEDIYKSSKSEDETKTDSAALYHGYPILTNIKRTYVDDYYKITTYVSPTIPDWIDGTPLVEYMRQTSSAPIFANKTWNYFRHPLDVYAPSIAMLHLTEEDGFLPFNPEKTYICTSYRTKRDSGDWLLKDFWIEDNSTGTPITVDMPIVGSFDNISGSDEVWGENGLWIDHSVFYGADNTVSISPSIIDQPFTFERVNLSNYYQMRLDENAPSGKIVEITVTEAVRMTQSLYTEDILYRIGSMHASSGVVINVKYDGDDSPHQFTISNASAVYMPFEATVDDEGMYHFDLSSVGANGIILYAEMYPNPDEGYIKYYRIPLSMIDSDTPVLYVNNKTLQTEKNKLRVVLTASVEGSETGRIEMYPVKRDNDGSYQFEASAYPLNELVDIDNLVKFASTKKRGGSWIPTGMSGQVAVDGSEPDFKIYIFIKSSDDSIESPYKDDTSFQGFRIVDEFQVDTISIIQELKEMRSTVNFGDSYVPPQEQSDLYRDYLRFTATGSPFDIVRTYVKKKTMGGSDITDAEFLEQSKLATRELMALNDRIVSSKVKTEIPQYFKDLAYVLRRVPGVGDVNFDGDLTNTDATMIMNIANQTYIPTPEEAARADVNCDGIINIYDTIAFGSYADYHSPDGLDLTNWDQLNRYYGSTFDTALRNMFLGTNVDGGMEVQLVPFVEYNLMNDKRFESFVSSFTQIHKAIEPVIQTRLEGNNYLDCKLIGTYGRPHSYCSDLDYKEDWHDYDNKSYWPDLNVQIQFDVKLYNMALSSTTVRELKQIVKDYFMRLTTVHTPRDAVSMDNNIYISHVIQRMEEHENVAYMKFIGWYTNEKASNTATNTSGKFMDSNYQAIVQMWDSLENFPKEELERYVPEMFVLDDDNIVINILN